MAGQRRTFLEMVARAIHVVAGVGCLGVAGWFLFFVSPFNHFGFWGFLLFGALLLLIGVFGPRKDVFLNLIPW